MSGADVIRFPGHRGLIYRARISWPEVGVAAVVDTKEQPSESFIAEVRGLLEKLYPLLVDQNAVLLQFGPEDNLYPPRGQELPAL